MKRARRAARLHRFTPIRVGYLAIALALAAGIGAHAAAASPPLPERGGALLLVDAAGGIDAVAAAHDGRRLVLALAADVQLRDAVRAAAAAAGRLGMVTALAAARLERLPAADGLATVVAVDDPADAAARGLRPAELRRVCAAYGSILVRGELPAAWAALAEGAEVRRAQGWTAVDIGLPAGQGEFAMPLTVDGRGSGVVDDAFDVRRNFISNWAYPEPNGAGSRENARASGLLRWVDGLYQNRMSKGSTSAIAAGDGVLAICSRDAVSSWTRGGSYFLDGPAMVLACRDAATGIVRWALPVDGAVESLAIHAGAVWTVERGRLRARSVVDGAERGDAAVPVRAKGARLVVGDGVVAILGDGPLRVVAASTGRQMWAAEASPTALCVGGGLAVVQVGDAVAAHALADGAVRWRAAADRLGAGARLRCFGAAVVVEHAEGLLLLAPTDGAVRHRVALPRFAGKGSREVGLVDGSVLVVDQATTRLVDTATGAVRELAAEAIASGYGRWPCARTGSLTAGMYRQLAGIAPTRPLPEPLGSMPIASACRVGAVVAYGTAYTPIQGCACYVGRMPGTVAVQEARGIDPALLAGFGPVERGESPPRSGVGGDDGSWPQFRAGAQRSQAIAAEPPARPAAAWSRKLAQPTPPGPIAGESWRGQWMYHAAITAPVIGGGLVLAALPAQHQVVAVDVAGGDERWRFTADGPIDGPPALHRGRAVFGCRDGRVYCLDLATGALVWRRGVVRLEDRICVYGQLESRFPVSGPVVALDGVVHATAGVSGQVGIAYAAFDLESGEQRAWRWLPRAVQHNDCLVADAAGRLWLGFVPIEGPIPAPSGSLRAEKVSAEPGLEQLVRGKVLPAHLIPADMRLIGTHRSSQPIGQMPAIGPEIGKLKESRTYPDGSLVLQRVSPGRAPVLSSFLHGLATTDWCWDGAGRVGLRGAPERLKTVADPAPLAPVAFGEIFELAAAGDGPPTLRWKAFAGAVWAMALTPASVVVGGPVVDAAKPEAGGDARGAADAAPTCIDPIRAPGRLRLVDRRDGAVRMQVELPATPVQDGIALGPGLIVIAGADGSVTCLR